MGIETSASVCSTKGCWYSKNPNGDWNSSSLQQPAKKVWIRRTPMGIETKSTSEYGLYGRDSKNPNGDWNLEIQDMLYAQAEFEEPQWGLKPTFDGIILLEPQIRRTPMGIETHLLRLACDVFFEIRRTPMGIETQLIFKSRKEAANSKNPNGDWNASP